MALIKCRECGREISDKAKQCPGCGAAVRKSTSMLRILGYVFGGFIVLTIFVQCNADKRVADKEASMTPAERIAAAEKKELEGYAAAARGMCRRFIEKRLHDPDSAEWLKQWEWSTSQLPNDRWSVVADYRAKNGFNATRTERGRCLMSRSGDQWKLESFTAL